MVRRLLFFWVISTTLARAGSLFGSDTLTRPSRLYDALHYKLEVRFDREKKTVIGTTTISLVPLENKLDAIMLHAVDMNVDRILLNGNQLQFRNDKKELNIQLDKVYGFEDTLHVSVNYSCSPTQGLYFLSPDSTNPKRHHQIWTQGEDMDNRYWFPCWDFPNDKATSEVIATVSDSWSLLSNGKLLDVKHDKANKTKTFHWKQSKPHVSYLVMIAAGEYEIFTEKYKNIPLEYYVYKERALDGRESFSATAGVMKFFEETIRFPYPWEKLSQIFIDDFMWGGMENTSAITYNTSYLIDKRGRLDFTSVDVVAHEVAHQWFGDLVTSRDWSEVWLNEGFANYYEALYKKFAQGSDEFQHDLMGQATSVIGVERAEGRIPVAFNGSHTANVYSKGAWILYMLHNILGDEEYHRAIELYVQRNAFTSVSTYDLMKAVEDATGKNMDWFFTQWAFKAGHPQFSVSSEWNESDKQLTLSIKQTQTLDSLTGVFRIPLEIECTTTSARTVTKVWLTEREQNVVIPLSEKPLMIIPDKGMKVLKSLKFDKSKDENIYQLAHATDIVDRIVAAKAMKEFPNDEEAFAALRYSALNDPFWAVRREATIYLGVSKIDGVKQAMFEIYKDKKSAVRNAAIVALENFKSNDVAEFLEKALAADSSYIVQSSCLQALVEVDSARALNAALRFVHQESHRDILRRSALQVFRSVHSVAALAAARTYAVLGNPPDIRAIALGVLRDAGEKDSLSRSLVLQLANDSNTTIRKGAIQTLGMWGGDDARVVLQERKRVEDDEATKLAIENALEEIAR